MDADYSTAEAGDGRQALDQIRQGGIDLVLLDLMLPEINGIDVCRQIRDSNGYVPIIMVTAMDDEDSRVAGLEVGADDYVIKPFSPRELVARVRAVLRRIAAPAETDGLIEVGDLTLDPTGRRCTYQDDEVMLTRLEFDLLAELAGHPRTVFTRDRLLEKVWGHQNPIGGKTVDVHIANLRRKLPGWNGLVAVRGVGYKVDSDVA